VLATTCPESLKHVDSKSRIEIADGKYAVRFARNAEEIEAALKLRFEVFNLELEEGLESSFQTGRDRDEFDATYRAILTRIQLVEVMKTTMQLRPRKQLLGLIIVFTLTGLAFIFGEGAVRKSLSAQKPEGPDQVVTAVRKGGLRESARIKKRFVSSESTTGWAKYDLESLTSHSSVVITGTPLGASSSLTPNGERIITEYKLKVSRIFKGQLQENGLIRLIVPGGKVVFDDGTSAEILTPDLGPITKNQTYILFLHPPADGADIYQLTGGGQGLFEVPSSAWGVKPLGDKKDLVQRHKDQTVNDFIEEIQRAVEKYPDTTMCCN
jgi:hypothetical protein